jgi:hypothetical protein
MYYTPETLLNHVFEDLRKPKAPNTKVYRVFNKSSGLVEVSSDVVFDETNGSLREQVDLDDVDEDEVPTTAM